MSGRSCWLSDLGRGGPLVSSRQRPGLPLRTLLWAGQPQNKEAPSPKCPQSRGQNTLPQQTVGAFILCLCFWQKDKSKTKPVLQAHTWSLLFSSSRLNLGLEKITGSQRPSLFVPCVGPSPTRPGPGQRAPSGQTSFSEQRLPSWLHVLFLSFQMFTLLRIGIL